MRGANPGSVIARDSVRVSALQLLCHGFHIPRRCAKPGLGSVVVTKAKLTFAQPAQLPSQKIRTLRNAQEIPSPAGQ
jgi:hypothetical protein